MGRKGWILGVLMLASAFVLFRGTDIHSSGLPVFSQPEQTAAALATEAQAEVEFPYVLRDTGLIMQNLASYDGPFLESEEQVEVTQAAAMMVYNPGGQWVRSAKILLTQGGREYLFEITYLPPNSRILVLEKNGQAYSEAPITDCRCLSISLSEFFLQEDSIRITETPEGLQAENLTGEDISQLVLYYKQYVHDGDFYLGGYTCRKEVRGLLAGERREVDVYRYVSGYSRVVAAEWEKSCCAESTAAFFIKPWQGNPAGGDAWER